MSEKMQQTTTVQEVDVNLDEIFNGAPGADSVVTPETKKPNVFSKAESVDLSFLDKPEAETAVEEVKEEVKEEKTEATEAKAEEVEVKKEETKTKEEVVSKEEVDEILNEGLDLAESEDEKSTASGRKRMSNMADVFKKMIDDEQIIPFDDDKELEDYTAKDWKELIQANMDERANKVRRETPKQFFNSLVISFPE